MRKLFYIFAGSILLVLSFSFAKSFWRGEVMAENQVSKRWGVSEFDGNKFKAGGEKERAQMAYSLLQNKKKFIGKDRSAIRQELGDFDGYYFSEMYPAYMIEMAKDNVSDSWQIVFLIDRKGLIKDIIVHKNCCER